MRHDVLSFVQFLLLFFLLFKFNFLPRVNVAAAVNVLNTTSKYLCFIYFKFLFLLEFNFAGSVLMCYSRSSAFGTAANGSNIDERTAQKLLAEEEAAMEKFRFSFMTR